MAPPIRKAKKSDSPLDKVLEICKKNVIATLICGGILVFCFSLLFATQHTEAQGKLITNMDTTTGQMNEMAHADRVDVKKSGWAVSEARKAQEQHYAGLTGWQRRVSLDTTVKYLVDLDFADTIATFLKAPSMERIFAQANPDLMAREFAEDPKKVWDLLDAWIAGNHNNPEVLGEDAVDAMDTAIKNGFWGGMEIFDEAETKYYSAQAWYAVRGTFLGRFFKAWQNTVAGQVAKVARGENLEWPQEPEKEKVWADEVGTEDVAHLDDSDFDSTISSKKHGLVMFYAPWCGHCKSFKPHFALSATSLREADVVLAGLDCTSDGKKTCKKYNVTGYPTIVYFNEGVRVADYDGGRTHHGVIEWMNHADRLNGQFDDLVKELAPPPELSWAEEPHGKDVVHLTDDDFESTINSKSHGIVMFYAPWCGHCKSFKPEFGDAATQLAGSDVTVGALDATKHPKSAKKYGVEGYPTIWYFKDGKNVEKYEGGRTAKAVVDYINDPKRMGKTEL
mmetsp:Transcript_27688/g.54527  ORF Transcript_27688/g.54527 Transcript_27688/m.54527 type:complete len:507 (+) Transcript_27688:41-1561(+)|eukprot:CAMPEP_0175141866 /NCGR_PEP_ID=MMETSP0087-20121206/12391_1 /TAXON_ID=136419 /ORGANISM="Unknown Unknown, Strain D1" /LENGTH=506 /DNA_ID=CAMNT_0016425425 /DNA_START=44 /DNA_END=1564 /DNA_ORIENTATION=+